MPFVSEPTHLHNDVADSRWWLWLNLWSLDAPLVAVLWQTALAHVYRVKLLPGTHLTLFLAVWVIYMMDRVLDSFAPVATTRMSTRHAFYRRKRKIFTLLLLPVVMALLGLCAFLSLPAAILFRGALLAFLVALYLLHFAAWKNRSIYFTGNLFITGIGVFVLWWLPLPHDFQKTGTAALLSLMLVALVPAWRAVFRLFPKELFCGWLFAVGCSLNVAFYTIDSHAGPLSPEVLLMAVLFALNCVAIGCYERKTDAAEDPYAISQTWPGIIRVYPVLLATFGALVTFLIPWDMHQGKMFLIAAITLSTLLLAALHFFSRRLTPELSRVLADAALALPVLLPIILL